MIQNLQVVVEEVGKRLQLTLEADARIQVVLEVGNRMLRRRS